MMKGTRQPHESKVSSDIVAESSRSKDLYIIIEGEVDILITSAPLDAAGAGQTVDAGGLYVNLFIPSELDWSEKGLKVRQETRFPEQQSTAIAFTAAKPVQMAVRLRIPSWLESSPTVKLNGKALEASAPPGGKDRRSQTEGHPPGRFRSVCFPKTGTAEWGSN